MYNIIDYTDCTVEQHREILALRNLDVIRKWMVNQEIISEENHLKFVESLKKRKDRRYFAVYKKGILIGTYNLTKENNAVWERGIIANPEVQGKGETEKWERIILNNLPRYGIFTVTAKVKQDNLQSIRYHEKLGYLEVNREKEYIYFKLNLSHE